MKQSELSSPDTPRGVQVGLEIASSKHWTVKIAWEPTPPTFVNMERMLSPNVILEFWAFLPRAPTTIVLALRFAIR